MCFNIHDSRKEEIQDRQTEDREFLEHWTLSSTARYREKIWSGQLGYGLEERIMVTLRFSVKTFEMKREILKAGMDLRKSKDELSKNIYLTPGLTISKEKKHLN